MSKIVVITGVFYSPIPEKEQGCISARNAFWKESAHRQGIDLEVWATCNRFSNEAVSHCFVKEFLGLPQDTPLDFTVPRAANSEIDFFGKLEEFEKNQILYKGYQFQFTEDGYIDPRVFKNGKDITAEYHLFLKAFLRKKLDRTRDVVLIDDYVFNPSWEWILKYLKVNYCVIANADIKRQHREVPSVSCSAWEQDNIKLQDVFCLPFHPVMDSDLIGRMINLPPKFKQNGCISVGALYSKDKPHKYEHEGFSLINHFLLFKNRRGTVSSQKIKFYVSEGFSEFLKNDPRLSSLDYTEFIITPHMARSDFLNFLEDKIDIYLNVTDADGLNLTSLEAMQRGAVLISNGVSDCFRDYFQDSDLDEHVFIDGRYASVKLNKYVTNHDLFFDMRDRTVKNMVKRYTAENFDRQFALGVKKIQEFFTHQENKVLHLRPRGGQYFEVLKTSVHRVSDSLVRGFANKGFISHELQCLGDMVVADFEQGKVTLDVNKTVDFKAQLRTSGFTLPSFDRKAYKYCVSQNKEITSSAGVIYYNASDKKYMVSDSVDIKFFTQDEMENLTVLKTMRDYRYVFIHDTDDYGVVRNLNSQILQNVHYGQKVVFVLHGALFAPEGYAMGYNTNEPKSGYPNELLNGLTYEDLSNPCIHFVTGSTEELKFMQQRGLPVTYVPNNYYEKATAYRDKSIPKVYDIVMYVRQYSYKRTDWILEFAKDNPDFRIAVYGKLDDEQAEKLLCQGITPLGYLDEQEYYKTLQSGKVFVSCSDFEGAATSVYDALANGVPVVAKAHYWGIREMINQVVPRRNGVGVSPSLPQANLLSVNGFVSESKADFFLHLKQAISGYEAMGANAERLARKISRDKYERQLSKLINDLEAR